MSSAFETRVRQIAKDYELFMKENHADFVDHLNSLSHAVYRYQYCTVRFDGNLVIVNYKVDGAGNPRSFVIEV